MVDVSGQWWDDQVQPLAGTAAAQPAANFGVTNLPSYSIDRPVVQEQYSTPVMSTAPVAATNQMYAKTPLTAGGLTSVNPAVQSAYFGQGTGGVYSDPISALQSAATTSFGNRGELDPALEEALMNQSSGAYDYSAASQSYLDALNQYVAQQGALGSSVRPYTTTQNIYTGEAGGANIPMTNAQLEALAASGQPIASQFETEFRPTADAGTPTPIWVKPSEQVRLVNTATGEVVYQGSGLDAAQQASLMASELSNKFGSKAGWALQTSSDPSTGWSLQAQNTPDVKGWGMFTDIALPIVGGAIGGPWGAAIGAGLSGTLQGKGIEDIALQAALAGGTAYGGQQLGSALQGAQMGSNAANAASSTGSALASGAGLGDIVVNAPTWLSGTSSLLGNIGAGALSAINNIQAPDFNASAYDGEELKSIAQVPNTAVPVVLPTPPGGNIEGTEEIKSVAEKDKPAPLPSTAPTVDNTVDITKYLPPVTIPAATLPEEPSGLGKWLNAGNLKKIIAGLSVLNAAGKVLGGTPKSSPAGHALQDVFSAKLPSASGIYANLAPRNMSGVDWARYGYGPEQSFFQNVPTTAAERQALVSSYRPSQQSLSAIGTSSGQSIYDQLAAQTGLTVEEVMAALASVDTTAMARGGSLSAKRAKRETFAINGAGTGRSDDIPAVLSDGEYVIDAETVALLGDGSSKAGAEKLDQLRVNVRKHKGSNLAKGKFSANAREPEAYLAGGRI